MHFTFRLSIPAVLVQQWLSQSILFQLKQRKSEWLLTVSETSADQLILSCTVADMELVSASYWATALHSVL